MDTTIVTFTHEWLLLGEWLRDAPLSVRHVIITIALSCADDKDCITILSQAMEAMKATALPAVEVALLERFGEQLPTVTVRIGPHRENAVREMDDDGLKRMLPTLAVRGLLNVESLGK